MPVHAGPARARRPGAPRRGGQGDHAADARDRAPAHVARRPRTSAPTKWERRFPTILATCRSHGVDPVTELIPVAPACHYASGGVAHRPVGPVLACPASTPSARSPAPACTAPTGWPPTRCSRAWCSRAGSPTVLPGELPPRREPGADLRAAGLVAGACAADAAARDDRAGRRAAVARTGCADGAAELAGLAGRTADGRPTSRPGRPPTCSRSAPPCSPRPRAARGDPRVALARGLPRARRRSTGPGTSTSRWSTAASPGRLDRPRRPRPGAARMTHVDRPAAAAASTSSPPPGSTRARVYDAVVAAVAEDLPGGEDVTSAATITRRAPARARLRSPARPAWSPGSAVAELVFRDVVGADVEVDRPAADGDRVARGRRGDAVSGPVPALLTAERTALNFACHLSGVATATARWVDALAGTGARVLDTRKTLPGLPRPAEVRRALRRRRQPPVRRCPTWRWSRTTTCSPPAAWCRRTRRSARRYPDLPVRGRGDRPRPAARAARRRVRPRSCSTT